ncbi:hypothetical protein [Saccharothrix lopnurensis]|uniref:Uncharacterized protein n=1 Tax=Saccharothrix lopnurensis TaxID=1670621 RepID=A0ABW1P6N3_9PSEU
MTAPEAAALAGQSTPAPVAPGWSLLAAESRTGRVVARLPLAGQQWATGLTFGSGTTYEPEVRLDGPPRADGRSVTQLVRDLCAQGPRVMLVGIYGRLPVTYGFITAPAPSPTGVRIGTLDLAGLLRRRSIITPGQRANPSAAAADTTLGPTSKPNLARLLLLQALGETDGGLPVDVSTVATAGTHARTYQGFRFTSYGDALADLADDEDGPDIRVTPTLSADQRWVRLRVDLGEPYLGRWGAHHWECPGSCLGIVPDYDYSQMGAWHYVPGDGTDYGKPVGVAYSGALLAAGVPLMDRVDATRSQLGDLGQLAAYARANAADLEGGLEALTLTVSAGGGPALGSYAPGDDCTVRTSGHWWLGNGLHRRRIVAIAGDHTEQVTITTAPVPEGVQ